MEEYGQGEIEVIPPEEEVTTSTDSSPREMNIEEGINTLGMELIENGDANWIY